MWVCRVIFIFIFSERAACGGGGGGGGGAGAARLFLYSFFPPCSADHEREWPPCKVFFFRVGNQYAECEKQRPITTVQKCQIVRSTTIWAICRIRKTRNFPFLWSTIVKMLFRQLFRAYKQPQNSIFNSLALLFIQPLESVIVV